MAKGTPSPALYLLFSLLDNPAAEALRRADADPSTGFLYLPPGNYRVASDVTLSKPFVAGPFRNAVCAAANWGVHQITCRCKHVEGYRLRGRLQGRGVVEEGS